MSKRRTVHISRGTQSVMVAAAYSLHLSRSGSREKTTSGLWCYNPLGQPPSISFLPSNSPLLQSLQFSRIVPQLGVNVQTHELVGMLSSGMLISS